MTFRDYFMEVTRKVEPIAPISPLKNDLQKRSETPKDKRRSKTVPLPKKLIDRYG